MAKGLLFKVSVQLDRKIDVVDNDDMIRISSDDGEDLVSLKCGCVLRRKSPKWFPVETWEYVHRCSHPQHNL